MLMWSFGPVDHYYLGDLAVLASLQALQARRYKAQATDVRCDLACLSGMPDGAHHQQGHVRTSLSSYDKLSIAIFLVAAAGLVCGAAS